jgi:hypothetical protein
MSHTVGRATALVICAVLGLTGCVPPSQGPSSGGRGRPWSVSDGPFTAGFDAAQGEVVPVPGGFAAAGWMRIGEDVRLVLRFSPDGEHWDWIPLPLHEVERPVIRLVGPDLAILTERASEIPVWTVQDIESLVVSVPTDQAPPPPRVGAGLTQRPV